MPTDLEHPGLKVPPLSTTIWRYMQFSKFTSMLLSESLFFTRCDKFKGDPWEAVWPKQNFNRERIAALNVARGANRKKAENYANTIVRDLPAINKRVREDTAISCWHMNESESDAFWRIYGRMDEGIAIRSTMKNLNATLSAQQKRLVLFSEVTYADYNTAVIPIGNVYWPVIFKRDSFKHENELRAIIDPWGTTRTKIPFDSDFGDNVPVELDKLILEVVVSPLAPQWFFRDVKGLIQKLGFSFPCRQSDLLEGPPF